jgi:heme/copper-type cytochrome/quinol oxidase subunit 2
MIFHRKRKGATRTSSAADPVQPPVELIFTVVPAIIVAVLFGSP